MASGIIYPLIGWIYIWLRYRDKEKVIKNLKEKYDNSYYSVGATIAMQFILGILGVLLVTFLIVIIISLFKNPLS